MKKKILAILFLLSQSFYAQMDPPDRELVCECIEEFKSLGCEGPREMGREKLGRCIESNKDKLSDQCKQFHEMVKNHPPFEDGREHGHRPLRD